MKSRFLAISTLLFGTMLATNTTNAHGIWVAQRTGELTIVYGHLAEDSAYETKKVKSVEGITVTGERRQIPLTAGQKNVTFTAPEDAVVLATKFDNGFWIKGPDDKWQNVGKAQIPGGTGSHQPLKYNTHILKPLVFPMKPTGAAFEIVPLVDPIGLKLGNDLPVQVYFNGTPLAEAKIINDYINNAEATIKADANGKAVLKVTSAGLNVVAAEHTEKTPGNADVDEIYYMSTLTYVLPHVE
jgi:nickel transport protein